MTTRLLHRSVNRPLVLVTLHRGVQVVSSKMIRIDDTKHHI